MSGIPRLAAKEIELQAELQFAVEWCVFLGEAIWQQFQLFVCILLSVLAAVFGDVYDCGRRGRLRLQWPCRHFAGNDALHDHIPMLSSTFRGARANTASSATLSLPAAMSVAKLLLQGRLPDIGKMVASNQLMLRASLPSLIGSSHIHR